MDLWGVETRSIEWTWQERCFCMFWSDFSNVEGTDQVYFGGWVFGFASVRIVVLEVFVLELGLVDF